MPSLDPRFVTLPPIQEQLWDKDLNIPLAAGIVTFYQDENRTIRKDVYQLSHLPGPTYVYNSLGSQLILSSIGTFVDGSGNNLIPYLFPFQGTPDNSDGTIELYYITVYSAAPPIGLGIEQFTVPSWPNISGSGSTADSFTDTANQLSNPQIVDVLFDNGASFALSVTGTGSVYSIAPGWDIITSGTGTVTLEQVPLDTVGIVTKPPYALSFSDWTGSITSAVLNQTLEASPGLLANSYVNGYMLASTDDGAAHLFTMNYVTSNSHTTELASGTCTADGAYTPISSFTTFGGSVLIPDDNSDVAPDGNVKIQIVLPINTDFSLTSFQFVGVAGASSNVEFIQESTGRQIDHLFHYYKPELDYKPIPSYLVGWDFPLNPTQFGASGSLGAIGANKSAYIWDQTIAFQTVTNSLSYAKAGGDMGLSLEITPTSDTSWALIQYIPVQQARELLSQRQCAQLRGYVSAGTLKGSISLWYTTDTNLPTVTAGTNNSLVSTITAGFPACANGTWTQVTRNLENAKFTLTGSYQDISFNGWQLTSASQTATYMAIVVAFDTTLTSQMVFLDYVSLQQGDIPTRPAPVPFDQTLRQCQYYYEKSYDIGIAAASNTPVGALVRDQACSPNGGTFSVYATPFSLEYSTIKRVTAPLVTFYTTAGVSGSVRMTITNTTGDVAADVAITQWQSRAVGMKAATYLGPTATAQVNASGGDDTGMRGWIQFQYTIDGRLGIVN